MQQIGGQIVWYQQLFQISLILAVILGIISVILFVSLDIKGTIGYVTGYRAKKEIKKLELDAENQSSRKICDTAGNLADSYGGTTLNIKQNERKDGAHER